MVIMSSSACTESCRLKRSRTERMTNCSADAEHQVADAHGAEQAQVVRAEVHRLVLEVGGAEEHQRDHDAVQVEVLQRDPEGLRRAVLAREQRAVGQRSPSGPPRPEPRVLLAAVVRGRPRARASARGSSTPQCAQPTSSRRRRRHRPAARAQRAAHQPHQHQHREREQDQASHGAILGNSGGQDWSG